MFIDRSREVYNLEKESFSSKWISHLAKFSQLETTYHPLRLSLYYLKRMEKVPG